jgi:hypothetical protein
MQRDCAKQTKPQNSSKTGPPPKIAYTMLLRETETLTENHLRLKDPHPTLCPLTDPQKTDGKRLYMRHDGIVVADSLVVYATTKRLVVYATQLRGGGRLSKVRLCPPPP